MKKPISIFAITFLSLLTLANNTFADINLGNVAYNEGRYDDAILEYSVDAFGGSIEAQKTLGDMYIDIKGIAPDPQKKAAFWFNMAAQAGDANAQTTLAFMYLLGEGVEPSYIKAAYWLQMAVDQRDGWAQAQLDEMYKQGTAIRYPKN